MCIRDSLDGALHSLSLGNKLQREANSLGIAFAETIGEYWAITERADVLETDEALFRTIQEEGDAPLRAAAALLIEAPRRALVCGTPRPGLAEALDQEREDYLADMKRAMTDAEIQALIEMCIRDSLAALLRVRFLNAFKVRHFQQLGEAVRDEVHVVFITGAFEIASAIPEVHARFFAAANQRDEA